MKQFFLFLLIYIATHFNHVAFAERFELDNGTYVDEYGEIHDNKYNNTDMSAPWNDSLQKDDILAPWNDPLQKDDITAPWNDPFAGEQDTNIYLRENNETNSDYYWN